MSASAHNPMDREPISITIARLGLQPPTFDRHSFVAVMKIAETHQHTGRYQGHKVHWSAAPLCPIIHERGRTQRYPTAVFRTYAAERFAEFPVAARCQHCNAQYNEHLLP